MASIPPELMFDDTSSCASQYNTEEKLDILNDLVEILKASDKSDDDCEQHPATLHLWYDCGAIRMVLTTTRDGIIHTAESSFPMLKNGPPKSVFLSQLYGMVKAQSNMFKKSETTTPCPTVTPALE